MIQTQRLRQIEEHLAVAFPTDPTAIPEAFSWDDKAALKGNIAECPFCRKRLPNVGVVVSGARHEPGGLSLRAGRLPWPGPPRRVAMSGRRREAIREDPVWTAPAAACGR